MGITNINDFLVSAKIASAGDDMAKKVSSMMSSNWGKKVPPAQLKLFWEKLAIHNGATFDAGDIETVVKFAKVDSDGLVDVSTFIDELFKCTKATGA
jgi:hypothetical protein